LRKWDPDLDLEGGRGEVSPSWGKIFLVGIFALGIGLAVVWASQFLYGGAVLRVEAVVVDEETGRPVEAAVYLDGRLIYSGVRSFAVEVPSGSELRVEPRGITLGP